MSIHKGLLESGRWFEMNLIEQLANIGCDVDRIIRYKKNGDLDASNKAFERALELLDFTIMDPKNRGPGLKEILRVREALVDHFCYYNEYGTTDESWQQYFYCFNYAAAIKRGR